MYRHGTSVTGNPLFPFLCGYFYTGVCYVQQRKEKGNLVAVCLGKGDDFILLDEEVERVVPVDPLSDFFRDDLRFASFGFLPGDSLEQFAD